LRHSIKPGLTGWAQIRYPYGASIDDARRKLQFDLFYVKNNSLVLDVLILAETVRVVLFGKGRSRLLGRRPTARSLRRKSDKTGPWGRFLHRTNLHAHVIDWIFAVAALAARRSLRTVPVRRVML